MKAKAAREVSFVELCIEERPVALNACRPPSSTRIAGLPSISPGANRGTVSAFLDVRQAFCAYKKVQ